MCIVVYAYYSFRALSALVGHPKMHLAGKKCSSNPRNPWGPRLTRFNSREICQLNKIEVEDVQGAPKKVIPYEKFDISGIVADFFTKFTAFTDEDSGHISCKFH